MMKSSCESNHRLGFFPTIYGKLFFHLESEVKAKSNTLPTYYSKTLSKSKAASASESGADEIYLSKWPHFQSLNFLRDEITARETISSLISKILSTQTCDAKVHYQCY